MMKITVAAIRSCVLLLFAGVTQLGAGPNHYAPPSSNPEQLYVFGDYVYFSADDGIHGRELWRIGLAGTPELVLDITPGPEGATIDNLCEFRGQLYFRMADGARSGDLWRTDGTPGGTALVRPFGAITGEMGVNVIVRGQGDRLYFTVGDPRGTSLLWSTDGTAEGTRQLQTSPNADPLMLENYTGCMVGGIHYLSARQHDGAGIWRTDGSPEGTQCLKRLAAPPGVFFTLDHQRFVFAGDDGVHGEELWISGGTSETTALLKDIYPGPETSTLGDFSRLITTSGRPMVAFAATNPESGRELWETDGTPEGTRLRADLIPGTGTSSPSRLVEADKSQYFVALGNGTGKELWRYNVEADAFEQPMDINSGISGSDPYALCGRGAALYFSALQARTGEELWVIRNTSSGPQLFADIYPGPESSFPYYTVDFKGRVVTVATSPVYGRELWISDSQQKEMLLFADINTDSSVNPSSFPDRFTSAGDTLFFTANDIAHGTELWRTDGTREGTLMVKDIFPGSPSSNPDELVALGNVLYFTADDGTSGVELWRSDGSTDGTSLVLDIHPNGDGKPRNLIAFKGRLYFSVSEPREGEELWVLEAGGQPKILKNIGAGTASGSPEKFFVWKDFLYFQADDGVHGKELWRSDGTSDGTVMVSDIVDAPFQSVSVESPREYQGRLYFAAELDGRGAEVWAFDDAQKRFSLVRDIVTGSAYDVLQAPRSEGGGSP